MASLGLARRNVEHKISSVDAWTKARVLFHSTILACCIAHPTHVQMIFWHLNLTAHRDRLALIDAMSQRVLDEDLRRLALTVQSYGLSRFAHHQCLLPKAHRLRQYRVLEVHTIKTKITSDNKSQFNVSEASNWALTFISWNFSSSSLREKRRIEIISCCCGNVNWGDKQLLSRIQSNFMALTKIIVEWIKLVVDC